MVKQDLKPPRQSRKDIISVDLCKRRSHLQVAWQWRGFANQGRRDGLCLGHWARCLKDPAGNVKLAEEGDYRYAKYNKQVGAL